MKVDRFCLWIIEEFRFLLNYRFDSESPMALVLVGQSELWEDKLRLKRYESPRQGCRHQHRIGGVQF